MNICLLSAFRNATSYLNRYYIQVTQLYYALQERHDSLCFVWGEGDSTDKTLSRLQAFANGLDATIVDCTHGGPVFGSVVNEQRFRQLAHVGNCLWKAIPANADVVVICESDLMWEADTLVKLIDNLAFVPAVAPMVMEISTGGLFYDTYCYRKDGAQFTKRPPYHPGLTGGLTELDSAGSCVAMNADLARHLVWDERVFIGICGQIKELGGSAWLNQELACFHP